MIDVHEGQADSMIGERVRLLRERIARAAARSGRAPSAVTLIAVTKTIDVPRIRAVALAGITEVGENRVQEAAEKVPALSSSLPLRWHLIGHLQRNKVRRAVELFSVIHSLDSMELATALSREISARTGTLEVLAQVNVSGEGTKSGFAPQDFIAVAERLAALPGLRWRGLMTIAPQHGDERTLRDVFSSTRSLQARVAPIFGASWDALSMGMSDDFELAIEEGSTHVRVGRAIFGERSVAAQG